MTSIELGTPTSRPDTSTLVVTTHSLTKRYGTSDALRDVTLQVPKGAVYLLVGANGAGKSTLFKILLDMVTPTAGTASMMGFDVRRHGEHVRANLGYVAEQTEWGYPWLRGRDWLAHHSRFYPSWDSAYAAQLADTFSLRLDQRMGTLSKGQARRFHLTTALAHRPPLLLLDEPTDGLDPVARYQTLGVLSAHVAATPTTVLVSTHHAEEFERFATHAGVLREGILLAQGAVDTLWDTSTAASLTDALVALLTVPTAKA